MAVLEIGDDLPEWAQELEDSNPEMIKDYMRGARCTRDGKPAEHMDREHLIAFVGLLDALLSSYVTLAPELAEQVFSRNEMELTIPVNAGN
jgi:hypothetical protein